MYIGTVKRMKFEEDVPIYEHPPPKYSAERILQIMLDPDLESSKICSTRPTTITCSATYIVDLSKLAHPDDIKHDNFGIWHHSGSHPQPFKVKYK